MTQDYALATRLKALGTRTAPPYYIATVKRTAPLTFSLLEGEVLAPPLTLTLTESARARTWEVGQQAVCLLGASLVVLDRI